MSNIILCLFVILCTTFSIVSTQSIVWDNYVDLCYFPRNNNGVKVKPSRSAARCEKFNDVIIERRSQFWCIVVNNESGKYKTLALEFDGTKNLRKVENYFAYEFPLAQSSTHEQFSLIKNEVVIVVYPVDSRFPMQRLTSVLLDDDEICDRARFNETDVIYPSQPNRNSLRFLNHCFNVKPRANRPGARCEKQNEVTMEWFRFNDEIPFYCVVIDKTIRKNGERVPETSEMLELIFESNNFLISWSPRANFASRSESRFYSFNFLRDTMRIAVYPKNPGSRIARLVSLKINNAESCDVLAQKFYVENCGKIKITARPLIAFGGSTYAGQYPWHVALHRLDPPATRSYICGGSIISQNAILTAAHCVDTANGVTAADALRVEAGKFDLSISNSNSQELRVLQVIVHEKFNRDYLENDIAIFKLATYLRFTDYVQPVCLSEDNRSYVDKIGKVPGWGRNENDQSTTILSEATMPIVSKSDCRESNRDFFPNFLGDGNFCAGFRNGTNVCTGDSGGGLVFDTPEGYILKGIVSLAHAEDNKCDITQFVIFTDVSKYQTWIYEKLKF